MKERLEDAILDGSIAPEERIPSTNELAKFYQINPATARQGVKELEEEGVLWKRRGVGMFVSLEGRKIILQKRQDAFYTEYILPLLKEAKALGISKAELLEMIRRGGREDGSWVKPSDERVPTQGRPRGYKPPVEWTEVVLLVRAKGCW